MLSTPKWLPGLFVLACATLACALPSKSTSQQVVSEVTVVVVVTAVPSKPVGATATSAPSATTGAQATQTLAATPSPSPTAGPQCTVLKQLNFRNGPGTAYYPVMRSFAAGTVLIPTGYNPVGNPGGAWAQVIDPSNNQTGWVSAGAEFLDCSIVLTTLSTVAVQPPPPPPLPVVSNLPAQGPIGGDIDFEVVMSPDTLMRILAREHGASKDGEGIDHVLFIVTKNGKQVYQTTEGNAKYCIFKGGEPNCNPWPKSNGRTVWGDGGAEVESGDYQVIIRVALKSDPTHESEWTFPITIQFP